VSARALLCLLFAVVVPLAVPAPAPAGRDVRVGTYGDAPLVSVDAQGRPVGLYIDILQQVAAQNGWRVSYVNGTWDDNLERVRSGKIDLVLDMAQTPKRIAEFSLNDDPVVPKWSQIYVRQGSPIKNVRDLDGQRVAVNKGDVTSTAVRQLARQWKVRPVFVVTDSTARQFELLGSGDVAAAATDNIAGVAYNRYPSVVPSTIMFAPFTTGFGTAKGRNADLLAAVDAYIAAQAGDPASSYNRALVRWLHTGETSVRREFRVPPWLMWALVAVAALAALFFGASTLFSHQVRRKTRELREQNAELRASEQRFRVLVDEAPEAIVVIDARQGVYVDANANALRLFGCSREELLGSRPVRFYTERGADGRPPAESVEEHSARALAGETLTFERLVRGLDGHMTPCAVSLVRLPSADRDLLRASFVDISDRKRAEADMAAVNQLLEERVAERTAQLLAVNEEVQAFAYSVSHDLRGPLRAIDGFSEILAQDYADVLDEEGRDDLRRVRAAAQHMGNLIDALLALSRLSRREIEPADVDVDRVAAAVVSRLRDVEPARQVVVTIADGGIVRTDPDLFEAVLVNLLENAWKFTRDRPEAHIAVGRETMDGESAFYVRDDGAGFDQAYADKLFQPFQRLHGADEYPGTGIGLATVRRIVTRLGGRCWARGAVGQGATFYFTLPGAASV